MWSRLIRVKWVTHIACAAMMGLALGCPPELLWLVAVGSILPDLIEIRYRRLGLGHRSPLVHNWAVPLAMSPLALAWGGALWLAAGYAHHLLLDTLTVYGVYVFGARVGLWLRSDRLLDNAVVTLLHAVALVI